MTASSVRARQGWRWLAALLVLGAILAVPLFARSDYPFVVGITIATFAVLSTGLNLVYGYTGLLSFAQVAFFGIGGYASAILVVERHWSVWAAVPVGAFLALCFGLLIGYSALRLSRHAFAIVSLSFALLSLIIARDWVELTRGPMGMPGLPPPALVLPGYGRVLFDRPATFYWLMTIYALIALAVMYWLVNSRLGRALKAIKLNEPLAQSQGINALAYKLVAIGVSAVATGIAGGFYVFYLTIVDPSIFDFYYTETMLIMVIVGGPGSFWGVVIASVVFSIVPDLLRFSSDLRLALYGIALIAAMIAFPRGFAGYLQGRRLARWRADNAAIGDEAAPHA